MGYYIAMMLLVLGLQIGFASGLLASAIQICPTEIASFVGHKYFRKVLRCFRARRLCPGTPYLLGEGIRLAMSPTNLFEGVSELSGGLSF